MARREPAIDRYFAKLKGDQRAALERVRRAIQAAAPKAEECISYQLPAFRFERRLLLAFGATSKHCALYGGSAWIAEHRTALAGFDTSKGTIRFQPKTPPSIALIRSLVKARIAEIGERRARSSRAGR